jgi:methylase of polypeptide subunit release factors
MSIASVPPVDVAKYPSEENAALESSVFPAANAADCRRIRGVLAKANYTEPCVCALLGIDHLGRLREMKLPVMLRRTAGDAPLATLVRLFVLGQPVDLAAARTALAPMTIDEWKEFALVDVADSRVTGRFQLRCYRDLVLAYDFVRRGLGGLRQDFVMGVSPSSLVLAGMTVRSKSAATLDLGFGCGIQAILAAPHSERVVGVDCNPRAVALARFNANLNQCANVDFREGDMFEPVRGETFDLIVSNPPFIISPENRHMFLNSGLEGDEICRRIVREAPKFLNEGGYCVMNANWAVVDGQDWRARLASWIEGTGCHGLVFTQNMRELAEYAADLIEVGSNQEAEYTRIFGEWMDYYAKLRITAIGQGVIAMRRDTRRPHWFAVEQAPASIAYPSGDDVALLMELRTFLHALPSEKSFLDARLKLAPNVKLDQICEAAGGAWRAASGRVRRVGGLEFSGALDGASAAALARWDGTRPLRDCLKEMAAALETDLEAFAPKALPLVRRLVEQGFLLPAD